MILATLPEPAEFDKWPEEYYPDLLGEFGYNAAYMIFDDPNDELFFPRDWDEFTPTERRAAEADCLEIARLQALFAPGGLASSPYREHYERLLAEYGWGDEEGEERGESSE